MARRRKVPRLAILLFIVMTVGAAALSIAAAQTGAGRISLDSPASFPVDI